MRVAVAISTLLGHCYTHKLLQTTMKHDWSWTSDLVSLAVRYYGVGLLKHEQWRSCRCEWACSLDHIVNSCAAAAAAAAAAVTNCSGHLVLMDNRPFLAYRIRTCHRRGGLPRFSPVDLLRVPLIYLPPPVQYSIRLFRVNLDPTLQLC